MRPFLVWVTAHQKLTIKSDNMVWDLLNCDRLMWSQMQTICSEAPIKSFYWYFLIYGQLKRNSALSRIIPTWFSCSLNRKKAHFSEVRWFTITVLLNLRLMWAKRTRVKTSPAKFETTNNCLLHVHLLYFPLLLWEISIKANKVCSDKVLVHSAQGFTEVFRLSGKSFHWQSQTWFEDVNCLLLQSLKGKRN